MSRGTPPIPRPAAAGAGARPRGRWHLLPTLLLLAPLAAQREVQRPNRVVPNPVEFATGQDDNLFSLGRSQDDIHEWEQALAESARGEHRAAAERMHRLLQSESGGVVPIGQGRFLGLRLAVVTTLANLPPAGIEAYETLVQREAGALAEVPLTSLSAAQLELLARRFPTSARGRAARTRLGDLAFEHGDGVTAAGHWRQALDAAAIGSDEERRLSERMATARVLVQPQTARAAAAARRLDAASDDVLAILPAAADPTGVPFLGGGDGRTPMTPPAGKPVPTWSEEVAAPGFDGRESGTFAMFPVGDLDGVYVTTGREVIAFEPLRRAIAWVAFGPMQDLDHDQWQNARGYEDQINQDCVLAPAVGGDYVVAALQVPERSSNVDFQGGLRIISKIPQRRLYAFHRATGNLAWAHFDEIDGPRTRRFRGQDSCGPPLVVGDTVYAPIHDRSGAIAFSLGAYDLATGALKWRRLVCSSQQDVNMFGNARTEFAASPLCAADGLLFGTSNLGVAFAIEQATGRLRWVSSYDVVRMPRTMLHNQMDRVVYFANNAPAVVDGVVCTTPLDSQFVLAFDTEQGQPLWRLPAEATVAGVGNDVRWLAGALDDEFVLAGRGAVAVKARPSSGREREAEVRQLVRPDQLRERADGRLSARPAVTADHVWFPATGRIHGFDRAGNPVTEPPPIRNARYQAGNLLLVDGIVVSLRQRALDVMFDADALLARVEARRRANPEDPGAILRLAMLRTALLPADASPAAMAAVQALFRSGLEECVRRGLPTSHPVRQALQRELYDQASRAAHAALERRDPKCVDLYAEARDAAPDQNAWLQSQLALLQCCAGDPARYRLELERLEQVAPDAQLNLADGSQAPVRAFVLWQRASAADTPPAQAVAEWQQLLELHPDCVLGGQAAANVAHAAIEALRQRHGDAVYAAVAARADAALAAAGDDPGALRAVSLRFPNARAAEAARTRLMDRSVRDGDLAMACEVLAQDQASGTVQPSILRRVVVAAEARGNRELARAMARRLLPFAGRASDWPEDAGADLAVVARKLLAEPAVEVPVPLEAPRHEITRITPRSGREHYRLLPILRAGGFPRQPDEPLWALLGGELHAIDLGAESARKPVLWSQPVKFLEHAIVCGTTLVIPDLDRLFAVDHRSGRQLWELPNPGEHMLDGLGVQDGVLHVSLIPDTPEAGTEFLGIEPTTGAVLFRRTLRDERVKPVPKPVPGQLVLMQTEGDAAIVLHRLDPTSGQALGSVRVAAAALQQHAEMLPDGLSTQLYPQGICADERHVYLPIAGSSSGDVSRLLAIDDKGGVAWSWQGWPGCRQRMVAQRGDRLVVIEDGDDRLGRATLVSAADGTPVRVVELGHHLDVLNWQRSWLPNPAPPVLVLSDVGSARERRLLCLPVEGDDTPFEVPLANDDGEVERQPLLGSDLLVFGARPAQRGPFRLYALHRGGRTGALADGAKYKAWRVGPTFGMAAVGPYTVIASAECLLVLGERQGNR